MTLGSCLIANESDSLGQQILERRIQGKNWSEIGDEFNLTPKEARKLLTKDTGIADYKIKGQALKDLVSQGIPDELKKGVTKVSQQVGAFDPETFEVKGYGKKKLTKQELKKVGEDFEEAVDDLNLTVSPWEEAEFNDFFEQFEKTIGGQPDFEDYWDFLKSVKHKDPNSLPDKAAFKKHFDNPFSTDFPDLPGSSKLIDPPGELPKEPWKQFDFEPKVTEYLESGEVEDGTADEFYNWLAKKYPEKDPNTLPDALKMDDWLQGDIQQIPDVKSVKVIDHSQIDAAPFDASDVFQPQELPDPFGIPDLPEQVSYLNAPDKAAWIQDQADAYYKIHPKATQKEVFQHLKGQGLPNTKVNVQEVSKAWKTSKGKLIPGPPPAPVAPQGVLMSPDLTMFKTSGHLASDVEEKIVDLYENYPGKMPYAKIQEALKAEHGQYSSFADIDDVIWNHLGHKYEGNVAKMLAEKGTSVNGLQAKTDITNLVQGMRKGGKSYTQIAEDLNKTGKYKFEPADVKHFANDFPKPTYEPYSSPSSSSYATTVKDSYGLPMNGSDPLFDFEYSLRSHADLVTEYKTQFPVGQETVRAISSYTGSGFTSMNGYLRGVSSYGSGSVRSQISAMDKAFRPITKPVHVNRNCEFHIFGGKTPDQMIGKMVSDPGYLSTSVNPAGVFSHKPVRLEIDLPLGTRAYYVGGISGFGSGEAEFLLSRGLRFVVKDAKQVNGKWIVKMLAVP